MADLMTAAPPTLAPAVLVELGMVDRYARFDAPIGPLVVAWNGLGVSAVEAAPDDATFEAHHLARTGRRAMPAGALPATWHARSARRLAGDRRVRIDLDLRGHTDFERDVWHKALEIPRGEVRPYGWIAAEIGRPKAVRAVGTALGHNPVPLIVPCHRVVRTDGSIGQYSLGGPENKRTILAAEGLDPRGHGVGRAGRASATWDRTRRTSSACRPAITPGGSWRGTGFRSARSRRPPPRATGRAGHAGRRPGGSRPERLDATDPGRVHSDLGPAIYANRAPGRLPTTADLGRPADPVRRLGIDLSRDRHRDRHDSRRSSMAAIRFLIAGSVLVAWSVVAGGPLARSPVGAGNGVTARSSARCCSAAGWAWSRSANRRSRPGSPHC